MSTQELKSILEQAISAFNNLHDRSAYFDLYDSKLITHGFPPSLPANLEGMKMFYNVLWTGFPDGRLEINDVIGQGDKLAVRYTFSGAQKGEFMGIAPTGKSVKIDGMTILKFAGTKCVERWNLGDVMSLMQQLGVIA